MFDSIVANWVLTASRCSFSIALALFFAGFFGGIACTRAVRYNAVRLDGAVCAR